MSGGRFVDPGALRAELTLEAPGYDSDGAGGQVVTWNAVATLFARIEPLQARSDFGAGQTLETETHRITMRWRADIESGMRLRRDERLFDIVTAHDPDETGRYLVCRVKEKGR